MLRKGIKLTQNIHLLLGGNQQGIIQLLVVIFILLSLAIGVYLVQTRTNLLPKAFDSMSAPISGPIALDSDKDGFSDEKEVFMGTNPNRGCPLDKTDDAWPVDINNDTYVNGADVSRISSYVSGATPYNKRYDLNQDGKIDQTGDVATIQDNFLKECKPENPTPLPVGSASFQLSEGFTSVTVGQTILMKVLLNTPIDEVNVASAFITFDPTLLEVTDLTMSTALPREIEKYYNADAGYISLIAGIDSPGIKNTNGVIPFAYLTFKAKSTGVSTIIIRPTKSEILRNSDSVDILNKSLTVMSQFPIQPQPTGTPTPIVCNPRPNIGRTTTMTPQGLVVTLSPGINSNTPVNPIKQMVFTSLDNATVFLGNQIRTAPFTYDVPLNTSQISFTINQAKLNVATTVQLIAKDTCGDYPLLFGGGTSAGWPTTIPSYPTPSPQVTVSAVPTFPAEACVLTKAEWGVPVGNIIDANTSISFRAQATGDCTNKQVGITVYEDDGILGRDDVKINPQPIYLVYDPALNLSIGKGIWISEFQEDGPFGSSYPPEFKFIARLTDTNIELVSNDLQVSRTIGTPSPVPGDTNNDQKADLKDLSWLLANWGKKTGNDLQDIRQDGVINAFDFSDLITILKQNGVLKSRVFTVN